MTNNCFSPHDIDILNFKRDEHISHSVVLIKGAINNCCSQDVVIIENLDTGENVPSKNIKRQNNCGSFKCLIRLRPNKNILNLKYCHFSKTIHLYFDKLNVVNRFVVKVYYVICEGHDGRFQSDNTDENSIYVACKRINLAIDLIQCLFAEKLFENGFRRKTFQSIQCQTFQSKLKVEEARSWSANEIWTFLAKEMIAVDECAKYVGLLGCTRYNGIENEDYSDRNIKLHTEGYVALGAGDVAIFGTGCLFSWPSTLSDVERCFDDKTPVDLTKLMDDSNNRHTYGGCFATTLGSLCHEIGHIFDLGHTNDGIMGNGFDYINRVFTNEMLTVLLPPRIVGTCQLSNECQSSQVKDARLTKIRKNNKFLVQYQNQKDNDLTFFCKNSMITAFYHKWFNQSMSIPYHIKFDLNEKIIRSKLPIRLIEFREPDTALTIRYFHFPETEEIFEFIVQGDMLCCVYDIFVVDDNGNIEKFSVSCPS